MKYTLLLFSLLALLFSACKTPQGSRNLKLKNRSAEYVQQQLIENQFNARRVNAKAKIKFDDGDRSMTVFSNIRMVRDSVIWLNAKAFGLEAGRVLIRPDSIFVLNRLQKEYMAKDIFWLQDEFGLPVDFTGLQAMLFGNPVFFHRDLAVDKDSTSYILNGENEKYKATYRADGLTFKLVEMLITQPRDERSGLLQLSDYQDVGNEQSFSFYRKIEMNSPETGKAEVRIDFTEVETDKDFSIPFNISNRYTKVN